MIRQDDYEQKYKTARAFVRARGLSLGELEEAIAWFVASKFMAYDADGSAARYNHDGTCWRAYKDELAERLSREHLREQIGYDD